MFFKKKKEKNKKDFLWIYLGTQPKIFLGRGGGDII